MKYCRKCGKELSDDSVFCDACGTKVVSAGNDIDRTGVQERSEYKKEGSFAYLNGYRQLQELMTEIDHRIYDRDYDVAAQKMRSAAELMIRDIYVKNGGAISNELSFHDILAQLEKAVVITPHSLSNYHLIRKYGNNASHGNNIAISDVRNMYNALVQETVEYADHYANLYSKSIKAKSSRSEGPKLINRIYGLVAVCIGVVFIGLAATISAGFVGGGSKLLGIGVLIAFGVIGIYMAILGIYGLITGKDIRKYMPNR